MGVVDKIEDLVFQSRALSSIEILKDKQVVVKVRCVIEKLSDTECCLLSAAGVRYRIFGTHLQVKEYGDTYVKIIGDRVRNVEIDDGDSWA